MDLTTEPLFHLRFINLEHALETLTWKMRPKGILLPYSALVTCAGSRSYVALPESQ